MYVGKGLNLKGPCYSAARRVGCLGCFGIGSPVLHLSPAHPIATNPGNSRDAELKEKAGIQLNIGLKLLSARVLGFGIAACSGSMDSAGYQHVSTELSKSCHDSGTSFPT